MKDHVLLYLLCTPRGLFRWTFTPAARYSLSSLALPTHYQLARGLGEYCVLAIDLKQTS